MKPRYAVINQNDRDEFEKEWHLPHGYSHNFISFNPQEAIRELHRIYDMNDMECYHDPNDWIVEKIDSEGRELYYRI